MTRHDLSPRNLEIRDNFDAIARRYDLTNRVISFGFDLYWRRVAVRQLRVLPPDALVLDLACGTCDIALEVLKQGRAARVVGTDLSLPMLRLAVDKLAAAGDGARDRISLVIAPAEALPFPDASFDGVIVAFGIRNVPDLEAGLAEMLRVLRPGGLACILEFSTPRSGLLWKGYRFYFHRVLPHIGGFLSGRPAAYRHLTNSVSRFPGAPDLKRIMQETGFAHVSYLSMTGSVTCVHTGVRP